MKRNSSRKPPQRGGEQFSAKQRALILDMGRFGIRDEEIAKVAGIPLEMLRANFADEIAAEVARTNAAVATRLFELCESGNAVAQMFWLKCRGGWRDQAIPDSAQGERMPDFVVLSSGKAGAKGPRVQ